MPVYYTVVQYLPDPVTDERINVGVIVFGDGQVRSHFLHDWRRVRQFGAEDIGFLLDFADRVKQATGSQLPLTDDYPSQPITEELLANIAGTWINSIQLTPARASLVARER